MKLWVELFSDTCVVFAANRTREEMRDNPNWRLRDLQVHYYSNFIVDIFCLCMTCAFCGSFPFSISLLPYVSPCNVKQCTIIVIVRVVCCGMSP